MTSGQPGNPSRRRLLAGAGAAGAGVVAGGLGGYFARPGSTSAGPAGGAGGDNGQAVAFYGSHQAGIATPAQDRLAFGTSAWFQARPALRSVTCCARGRPRPRG